jgi:putative tryptophan/tyrosine transport system substrate-binding protein
MLTRVVGAWLLATLLCSVAVAETSAKVYRVGLLHVGAPGTCILSPAFEEAFARRGFVAGKSIVFERFAADGQLDRLPGMVDQMIGDHVDLIATCGYPAAMVAKQRAADIPVVVTHAGDPVETGMVDSLAHPGGHVTGVSQVSTDLSAKRLQLLKETIPSIHTVAMLWNEGDLAMQMRCNAAQGEAKKLGLVAMLLAVRAPNDFAEAFTEMDRHPPDAILLVADSLTVTNHQAVFDYAAAHRIPDMEEMDFLAHIGGLMAYGPNEGDELDRVADMAVRILRGAKPADLPLELPTRFRFSVNLKTAHDLGITIPETILVRSDDVIE